MGRHHRFGATLVGPQLQGCFRRKRINLNPPHPTDHPTTILAPNLMLLPLTQDHLTPHRAFLSAASSLHVALSTATINDVPPPPALIAPAQAVNRSARSTCPR